MAPGAPGLTRKEGAGAEQAECEMGDRMPQTRSRGYGAGIM